MNGQEITIGPAVGHVLRFVAAVAIHIASGRPKTAFQSSDKVARDLWRFTKEERTTGESDDPWMESVP